MMRFSNDIEQSIAPTKASAEFIDFQPVAKVA
jgi:hypothetical protein